MVYIKRLVLCLTLMAFFSQSAFSADVWVNNLRRMFIRNSSIIYEINLRTFGAQDINKDGIIEFSDGEESGTFLNAIPRLDELAQKWATLDDVSRNAVASAFAGRMTYARNYGNIIC